jgi:ubiquitin-protein ligase E3 C
LGLVSTPPEALLEQLLHTLLAVPALPSSLPIPSLTHLSSQLPLFNILLPLAAQRPGLLNSGRLSSELGKTYFLANLVTFGLTGGMLARYGFQGAQTWIKVIGMVLQGVQEGWGRWVDGQPEEVEEAMPLATEESDDEGEDEPKSGPSTSSASRSRPARPLLQPAVQKKVVLLASAAHLGLLADTLLSPSTPSSALVDFAGFALPLLSAFRGSPRWEGILESLMTGAKGKALEKRLWREGVRGKWSNSGDRSGWDHFAESKHASTFVRAVA